VTLPDPLPPPRDATAEDLASAQLVVALKEDEHRPLLAARFPGWANRVRYWDVDDLPQFPPEEILGKIERLVRALVDELSAA
jgi:protein-tyrosine phosphatase